MLLKAHGTAVGLPSDDDMGNSEVTDHSLIRMSHFAIRKPGSEALDMVPALVTHRTSGHNCAGTVQLCMQVGHNALGSGQVVRTPSLQSLPC